MSTSQDKSATTNNITQPNTQVMQSVENIYKIETSDNQIFDIPHKDAIVSVTLRNIIEDMDCSETVIPLPNVSSAMMEKVLFFLKTRPCSDEVATNEGKQNLLDSMSPWDKEFCDIDRDSLFELIMVANYLDIKALLDVTCKAVALQLVGKTPEEVRKTFNIKNDFTPEEEMAIMKENEWCENK